MTNVDRLLNVGFVLALVFLLSWHVPIQSAIRIGNRHSPIQSAIGIGNLHSADLIRHSTFQNSAFGNRPSAFSSAFSGDFKTLLTSAARYAADYHERFTALVAEEDYVQRTGPDPRRPTMGRALVEKERRLKSEYVIVRDLAGSGSWVGVRDVMEVDGEPVPDRGRLRALLDDTSRPLAQRLRALADLEAKYNIGGVYRTINVPTLALEILLPDRQPRFRFKNGGPATLAGAPAVRVNFQEREHPTIIQSPSGENIPARGTFWLDPSTGAVLRTELRVSPTYGVAVEAVIIVTYKLNPRFEMLLPDDMDEMYFTRSGRIEGHATYANYRRFETDVRIK